MAGDHGIYYAKDAPSVLGKFQQYDTGAAPAGSATVPAVVNSTDWSAGMGVLVRAGGPRLALGLPAQQVVVDPSYVVGGEILTLALPASQDWSAYDELRFDFQVTAPINFGKLPPGGLAVAVKDSQGRVVSRSGIDGNWTAGAAWVRGVVPLDQTFPLADVASLSFAVDLLIDGTNKWHSLGVYDQSGPHFTTGSGFTLSLQNFTLCSDLRSKVVGVSGSSLTLANPLASDLPETILAGAGYYRGLLPDDSDALNAWLATVPDFCEVVFEPGQHFGLAAPLVVRGRQGLHFNGRGAVGASGNNYGYANPAFFYLGRGGGFFTLWDHTRDHIVRGLTWNCPMRSPCSAVEIDMLPGASGTTTGMTFYRCFMNGPLPVSRYTGHTYAGVSIARVSSSNCEYLLFEECQSVASRTYPGGGYGFSVGPHTNAKRITFRRCAAGFGLAGWRTDGGSIKLEDCHDNYNGVSVVVNGAGEPVVVNGHDSEYCGGALYLNTSFGAKVEGSAFRALLCGSGAKGSQGAAVALGSGGGYVGIEFNKFDPHPNFLSTFYVLDPTSVAGHIRSRGNLYNCPFGQSNFTIRGGGQWSLESDDKWSNTPPYNRYFRV